MEDQRFAPVVNNPKFRKIPKKGRKIKIDKRFQSMFKDKKFKVEYTTDHKGRPVNYTSNEGLKQYYDLSSEDESSSSEFEEELDEIHKSVSEAGTSVKTPTSDESSKSIKNDKSDNVLSDTVKKKLQNLDVDYARGESALCSDSSSDDEESEYELSETEDIDIDHKWGEMDADAEKTDDVTNRLAACNMDWDRIRAVDLMVLFNSFLPSEGVIKSVVIYPSEFGKKRMKEEEIKGPIELTECKIPENDNENEEGSNYHMEKLRQYQLNRLKYYYAVITFDSPNSANKIYTECDGMEYESSATKMDLRFVPDDMDFDNEPKEICDKLPDGTKYQPRFFTTTALQQAKVDLTWDETNPDRLEIAEKLRTGKIDGISDADLQNYLASSSGEESENEEIEETQIESGDTSIEKYKALLQGIGNNGKKKSNKDMELEISWGINLKEKTDKLMKEKAAKVEERTPFQQYLDKRKQKRKEKREARKNTSKDSEDDDSDIPSDIDMNDKYFAEEFAKDEFKKKKNNKIKQKNSDDNVNDVKDVELELLLMDETDNRKHFSLKKIQEQENESKRKKKKNKKGMEKEDNEDDFKINVADERFSAIFTSHHFNIDPTDPHYKKTKGMEVLVNEKLKRRNEDNVDDNIKSDVKKAKVEKKNNAELNMLVKSVKRKVTAFKNK